MLEGVEVSKIKKKKKRINSIMLLAILIIILIVIFNQDVIKIFKKSIAVETMYIASTNNEVEIYHLENDTLIKEKSIPRGTKITTKNNTINYEEIEYKEIFINNNTYYVTNNNLVKNKRDVVKEKIIYVRTPTSILKDLDSSQILSLAKKKDEVEVLDYNYINESGDVDTYKIKFNDQEGYIYGKYTTISKEEASKNYDQNLYDNIYSKVSNTFNGGEAKNLDFYPYEKANFKNNIMPNSVYSLYLNCSNDVINNIDNYIEFAKDTKINSFVVDIKDNESPAYPAKTFKELSPTNYEHAINNYDKYKEAIIKLKEAGFYIIGRITTFKDSYFVKDNPNTAIMDKNTNSPYQHNGSYWPSAYNRDVWYYNVSLAKEAVEEFGFNEINFDYVRFPDRMQKVESEIDLRNTYNEDKTQAIEHFVRYATDEIHKVGAYVSIDVFGETTNGTYTTAYGQYWPSISNIADVISGMPYPDHFSNGYYGINKPWNHPYELLKTWGTFAMDRQNETPSKAKVRTWIQAYDVMKYVDSNGISYNAEEIEEEIRALYESGLDGGYITWLSNSSLNKYNKQKDAFKIDYQKEYNS